MENHGEQQPEQLGGNDRHSSGHSRSYPNLHQQSRQFRKTTSRGKGKKSNNRSKSYNKTRNHNRSYNSLSDGSVHTASSEGSFNNRNWGHPHYQNNKHFHNSWSHSSTTKHNGRSKKTSPQDSKQNSLALTSYLRQRGWSLPDDQNPNGGLSNNKNNGTSNSILRGSELVRKEALKLLETTLCRWASSLEKNPNAWQRVRGEYRTKSSNVDQDTSSFPFQQIFLTTFFLFRFDLPSMILHSSSLSHYIRKLSIASLPTRCRRRFTCPLPPVLHSKGLFH